MAPTPPLSETRLRQIATDACESTLGSQSEYVHSSTPSWNSSIINKILEALISETAPARKDQPPAWKFCVNSTIIQHPEAVRAGEEDDEDEKEGKGRGKRGMHAASGAYWNNEKDGMWNFKFQGEEQLGMDVVVTIMWISAI
ncbi:dynein light chain, cytosolic [Rhizodiscina lignyota]|uniref:Dynein light chain, cytosolic n=1 Tax=Rhizodiscina lignyota TaxID=1504668 RepID=A0A9P4MAM0_9PEZI|nr:dynein light chain, cytosolic [Rhizodiscina lignyota]